MSIKPTPAAVRLWSRVKKGPGCWEWMGSIKPNGYGQISVGGKSGTMGLTHRVAWESVHGPPPPGMFVCHRCDNRRCVNPAHLFLGTHADNMRDRNAKRRQAHGEHHARATITEAQAIEAKRLFAAGIPPLEIAKALGISHKAAGQAGRGTTWRHL